MDSRVIAALSLIAMATFGLWLTGGRRKLARPADELREAEPAPPQPLLPDIEIDDDEAAEIIRRAKPALERARRLV